MNMSVIETALCNAVIIGARQLRADLIKAAFAGNLESRTKADGTSVTTIDMEVERAMGEVLATALADVTVIGEEGTTRGTSYEDADEVVFFDPTDGTALVRLFASGSTTGACLYDKRTRQFTAAAVADPSLGRLVYTVSGLTYQRQFDVTTGVFLGESLKCRVSDKTFADGGELLIEVAHAFTRTVFPSGDKQPVLNLDEMKELWAGADAMLGTKVRSLSSNLAHQVAVAVGSSATATIMTAIGGPWDMSGVALVLGAGGYVLYVRCFSNEFTLTGDPLQADLVISANSNERAWEVYDLLRSLRNRG